ncbi:MAG: outer membrane beta-barrel protein [Chitinophagaceae bacterium]|nr:outer membrane beta-barrel protein [Chitinophagaceae bacterium]
MLIPSIIAMSQDKDDKTDLFFRVGLGYGQRLAQVPPQIDADGKDLYRNVRRGTNFNFQLGYMVGENTALAAVYSRFGSKQSGKSNGTNVNIKDALTFAGITIQKFIPVGEKKDVNFNTKIGPGALFLNNQTTVFTPGVNTTTYSDINKNRLGLLTGIGVDFHLSKTFRFELNIDKTWGRIKENNVVTNLEFIAIGGGFRLQF